MKAKLLLHKAYDKCKSRSPQLTVVLIHGIASDSVTYKEALKYLTTKPELNAIRFVAFDLLGSGKSPKSDKFNYDYKEQLKALKKSIRRLKCKTPIVLVGHSLGTFIVTRFASKYPKKIQRLILISPPIFTKKDFKNPAFALGIEAFKKAISVRNPKVLGEKAFINSLNNIVLSQDNYEVLTEIKVPTTMIYGKEDRIIASYNVPGVLRRNSLVEAVATFGGHSVKADKYRKLAKLLIKEVDA